MDYMTDMDYQRALNTYEDFVADLFSYNVVIMENALPDIQVKELKNDAELVALIHQEIGDAYLQLIVCNNHNETKVCCPFFRIIAKDFDNGTPINYKLQHFYNKINMSSLNPRCTKAIVIGLASLHSMDSPLGVPYCFSTTDINPITFSIDGEIDMACLTPCGGSQASSLYDVTGMALPCHVPDNIQWNILSYCRSPTAQLIQDKIRDICYQWDMHLYPMFMQREPRIPPTIASTFRASTVTTATSNATRPFLASVVPGRA